LSRVTQEIKSNNLFVKGIVVDTNDPKNQSRLKVRIPCYHGASGDTGSVEDSSLPWAQTCLQNNNVFKVGDIVWLTFEGGDSRYPILFGQLGSTSSFTSSGSSNGLSSGSLGIVGGSYDITIDGHSYHVEGATLAEMGVSIITINEGGSYEAYNGYDVNGISIGLLGFHLNIAFDVLKETRDKNPSNFDNICTSNGASSLISDITSGNSSVFDGLNIVATSSTGKAIKAILATDECHEVQLARAAELVQGYIDLGVDAGVSDNGALLFLADISNQGPHMTICKNMRSATDKSLDNYYNMTKDHDISGYDMYNRRTLTYKIIKELQTLGALNGTGGVLELPSGANASSFVNILKDTMDEYVSKYNSNSWDYYQGATRDSYSIRGKSIKTRTDCSGFVSAALMVLSQETGGSYASEVDNWNSSKFMSSTIKGFDKLDYKYSDLKPGDIVVRQGHVQAIASINPVKIYNCGSPGFGADNQPTNWWEGDSDDKYSYIFRIKESSAWLWPVPSCKSISSPYGYRTFNGGGFHKGIDIPGASGTPIVATRAGTVKVAEMDGRAYNSNGAYVCGGTGYGICTVIDHGDDYYTLYAHQSSTSVSAGQQVSAGQTIGAVGNTGNSFGAHLHFEVRKSDGTHYDPQNYISINQ